jgi:hypothetical protein
MPSISRVKWVISSCNWSSVQESLKSAKREVIDADLKVCPYMVTNWESCTGSPGVADDALRNLVYLLPGLTSGRDRLLERTHANGVVNPRAGMLP